MPWKCKLSSSVLVVFCENFVLCVSKLSNMESLRTFLNSVTVIDTDLR